MIQHTAVFSYFIRIFLVGFIGFLLFSCKNEDDNDADRFQGIYVGKVTYTDAETQLNLEEATIEVEKIADQYHLTFPQGIPAFPQLSFEEFNTAALNIGADSIHLVRITDTSLQVNYTNDHGATWTANTTK
ncbi:MAG TPA: hypothetical protein VL022_02460 [Moheibacter sp.]|nr:hypothetical protein [Moheibacter sp.]